MKEAGARIVARTPIFAMCFSTSYLLSKCGTPVCRLAEATDVKTRCTPAALAASAAAIPSRVSAAVPPYGSVTEKREVAPSSAFLIAAVSSSDAATSEAPAFASAFAWLEFTSRVMARTWWPRSSRPRATAPPCFPVDPVTTTVNFCAMSNLLFLRLCLRLHARLEQSGKRRSHVEKDHRPQKRDKEGQRKPGRGHGDVKNDDVDQHRREYGYRERYVPVDQQKRSADDLKREDHPQVVRNIKRAHELRGSPGGRRKVNEVQEAVQPHNQKDRARQVPGDCSGDSHNLYSPFELSRLLCVDNIDANTIDDVYFRGIQVFYDSKLSGNRLHLAGHDEGDARPHQICDRRH